MGAALRCHDPLALFSLQLRCASSSGYPYPSQSSPSSSAVDFPAISLARTITLTKIAVIQNKCDRAIKSANTAIALFSNSGAALATTPAPTKLLWNLQAALLQEVVATWHEQDPGLYQESIQLLQVSWYFELPVVRWVRVAMRVCIRFRVISGSVIFSNLEGFLGGHKRVVG